VIIKLQWCWLIKYTYYKQKIFSKWIPHVFHGALIINVWLRTTHFSDWKCENEMHSCIIYFFVKRLWIHFDPELKLQSVVALHFTEGDCVTQSMCYEADTHSDLHQSEDSDWPFCVTSYYLGSKCSVWLWTGWQGFNSQQG
jgi:hypothetical protein